MNKLERRQYALKRRKLTPDERKMFKKVYGVIMPSHDKRVIKAQMYKTYLAHRKKTLDKMMHLQRGTGPKQRHAYKVLESNLKYGRKYMRGALKGSKRIYRERMKRQMPHPWVYP